MVVGGFSKHVMHFEKPQKDYEDPLTGMLIGLE
jgi:hypothetical protein